MNVNFITINICPGERLSTECKDAARKPIYVRGHFRVVNGRKVYVRAHYRNR